MQNKALDHWKPYVLPFEFPNSQRGEEMHVKEGHRGGKITGKERK